MSAQTPLAPGAPWYRQFWPWFIVGMLGVSVVGSLSTVAIALLGADPEVRRDYVVDARAVVPLTGPRDRALALGLGAMVGIEADGSRVSIETWSSAGAGVLPERMVVHFVHPTLAERDVRVVAVREADGVHRAALPSGLEGRYEIGLSPEPASRDERVEWELASKASLAPGAWIVLGSPRAGARPGAG